MFFELFCPELLSLFGICFLIWILLSFLLSFAFFDFEDPCGAADKGVKTASVIVLIILATVLFIFHFNDCQHIDCAPHVDDCQCIDCAPHADDCQCNECVIDRCDAINHGDTCQCDKCIECKNIGGN